MTAVPKGDFGLSRAHPVVLAGYFAVVLAGAMTLLHPAALVLSLLGALAWSIRLGGGRMARLAMLGGLPLLLLTALLNGLFNNRGVTILLYVNGNPLTLEALAYGAATGAMLCAVLLWFSCWNRVMTSDKLLCVLGRLAPAFSLVFSMTLRFVPCFREQAKRIAAAQRGLGRSPRTCGRLGGVRQGARQLSILTTWALENGIDTADSMRARGYGLRGRTQYSRFRFSVWDGALLFALVLFGALLVWAAAQGWISARYFPLLTFSDAPVSAFLFAAYGLVCFLPILMEGGDTIRWKRSISRM